QTLTTHARGEPESGRRITKVLALLAVLALYTFSLEPLGYPLCTFLLVLFMLRVTDPQRWPVALGMAALTAAGSYIVFAVWLSVPLPRGPLSDRSRVVRWRCSATSPPSFSSVCPGRTCLSFFWGRSSAPRSASCPASDRRRRSRSCCRLPTASPPPPR